MLQSDKLKFIDGRPFKKWSIALKSSVIESLILNMPPPSILIDGAERTWYIMDGAELLLTIAEYINNDFKLENEVLHRPKFTDLHLKLRSRLSNLEIVATIINPDTPPLHRLELYNTSLLKIGKEADLWNCTQAVYPEEFKKIVQFASDLGIKDPHLLWQIMTAMLFAPRFESDEVNPITYLGNMRFNIFESFLLERFDVLQVYVELQGYRAMVQRIARVTQNFFKNDNLRWNPKKRTILTIVLTLLARDGVNIEGSETVNRFEYAWKKSSRIGEGTLYKDYIKKTSTILLKYMKR
ncbi:MAG: hypothetical protein K2K49_02190 [Duncaniella sp.]|nr:hypothetical protein [Duncaniella sp.]